MIRKTLPIIAVSATIFFVASCDKTTDSDGKTLYMKRDSASETERAKFVYASDCELVAEKMNASDKASWYCR